MIALPPPQPPGPHLCVGALGARRGRRQGPPSLRRYLPPPLALRPVSPTPIPSPPPDHAHAGPLQAGFAPPPPPHHCSLIPPPLRTAAFSDARVLFPSQLHSPRTLSPLSPHPHPRTTSFFVLCLLPPPQQAVCLPLLPLLSAVPLFCPIPLSSQLPPSLTKNNATRTPKTQPSLPRPSQAACLWRRVCAAGARRPPTLGPFSKSFFIMGFLLSGLLPLYASGGLSA